MNDETTRDAAPAAKPEASSGFNLSRWALDHRPLTRYLMVVLMFMGGFTYFQLGQDEDPPFTFRAMVVRTLWPGATTQQMAELVTAKLERSLQEVPYADKIRSYSKPGESQIIMELKDYSKPSEVANVWYTVRKKIGDIRPTLPAGIQGPFFNDEFGDVYGIIYALESDGFNYAEVKVIADQLRQQLLRVKDVAKVEIFGAQDEKIFVDISKAQVQLGLDMNQVLSQLPAKRGRVRRLPANTARRVADSRGRAVSGGRADQGHAGARRLGQPDALGRDCQCLPRLCRSAIDQGASPGP